MPRFALLHHRTPPNANKPDHYDLLLEDGQVLKTFTLWQFPEVNQPITALADFDHRPVYLDYEGPISGNRGEVTQADQGTFEWIVREAKRIEIQVAGRKLIGRLTLETQDLSSGDGGGEGTSATS
ncbi:hypothetical protein GC197_15065 [bacterium]|nr:hypothetical protein [bacterium]